MTDHRITTTMRPDQVVTVTDTELQDLERMNVVASRLDDDQPTQEETADVPSEEEEPKPDGEQAPEAEQKRLRSSR